ncbi:MAG TPA: hypothetical protein VNT01_08095 [Symbiobacteriaceae bacterium]|nr:hypothetical protein [Symbiobacteriaceae bacterium]
MSTFERYELAQLQQQMLTARLTTAANQNLLARTLLQERAAERRFLAMYRVRHWLHRMAPRIARSIV